MKNLILSLTVLALSVSCTRETSSTSRIQLSVPKSQKLTTQNTSAELNFVAINLRVDPNSGSPDQKLEFEFKDANLTGADTISLVVDDAPSASTLLVQFLGVYETEEDLITFSYGESIVNTSSGGDVGVDISAEFFGTASKEGEIFGRLLTGSNSGPTGSVIMSFQPPNGRPTMEVHEEEIFSGWFNFFVLDGDAKLTYTLEETGEVLFSELTLDSTVLSGSNQVMRITQPSSIEKRFNGGSNGSELELNAPREYIGGFFSNNGVNLSNKKVCFREDKETINRLFQVAGTSPVVAGGPMAYKNTGASSADIQVLSGGVTESSCNESSNAFTDELFFNHSVLGGDTSAAFGIDGPFQLVDKSKTFQNFFTLNIDDSVVGSPKIDLNWKYLPGVFGSAVDGVTIFFRQRPQSSEGGDDDDDDDLTCKEIFDKEGYTVAADLTSGEESYAFDNLGSGLTFSGSPSVFDWEFGLCPFRVVNGNRQHFKTDQEASCLGSCDQEVRMGFGNKIPGEPGHDFAMTTSSPENFTGSNIGGAHGRITAVSNIGSLLRLTVPGATGITNVNPGDEILVIVTGDRGSSPCGTHHDGPVQTGFHFFTRAIASASNSIDIVQGTHMDKFLASASPNISANLVSLASTATFCHVQAVKVPHFGNLTIDDGHIHGNTFAFSNAGGGIVAMRVNGTLTLNSATAGTNIHADSIGYGGATSDGDGTGGFSHTATVTGGVAGTGSGGGGGGGHVGNGGKGGGTFTGGSGPTEGGDGGNQAFGGGGSDFHLIMGGGGAGNGSDLGGMGGGILFVAARKIVVSASETIGASGGAGNAPGGPGNGTGGGAAGTVVILSEDISGAGSPLAVDANGGDGVDDTSGTDISGGGGSGGKVQAIVCDTSQVNANVTGGAIGTTTGENASDLSVGGDGGNLDFGFSLPDCEQSGGP